MLRQQEHIREHEVMPPSDMPYKWDGLTKVQPADNDLSVEYMRVSTYQGIARKSFSIDLRTGLV